jgi:hypothetical protein
MDMNARRSVNAARCLVRGPDLCDQRGIGLMVAIGKAA